MVRKRWRNNYEYSNNPETRRHIKRIHDCIKAIGHYFQVTNTIFRNLQLATLNFPILSSYLKREVSPVPKIKMQVSFHHIPSNRAGGIQIFLEWKNPNSNRTLSIHVPIPSQCHLKRYPEKGKKPLQFLKIWNGVSLQNVNCF